MAAVALQRCLHHGEREAIARCPECGSFFCRECITEHDERVLCASCLAKITRPAIAGIVGGTLQIAIWFTIVILLYTSRT